MRLQGYLVAIGFCVVSQGCNLAAIMTRNAVDTVARFESDVCERIKDHHRAGEAWAQVEADNPGKEFPKWYREGFKRGFIDYLYEGAQAESPPLPPHRFWLVHFENEEGYGAMQEWFAGYRHGHGVAVASGYREHVIVPVTLPPGPTMLGEVRNNMSVGVHPALPSVPPPVLPGPVPVAPVEEKPSRVPAAPNQIEINPRP